MDEPLVLLPGMNCSPQMWSGVEAAVTGCIPGLTVHHGRLAADSIDGCVEELLGFLPSRFALAGLSLGAIVAMALVRQAPERVSRLCLLSANPHAPTAQQYAGWEALRRDLAAGRTARDVQRELLPILLHPSARTPQADEKVLDMAERIGAEVLDRQLAAQASRIDERPTLVRVAVPTLIVAAAEDALCSVWKHEELRDLIPGSQLVVMPGVGHLSTVEAPARVAEHLAGWLSCGR